VAFTGRRPVPLNPDWLVSRLLNLFCGRDEKTGSERDDEPGQAAVVNGNHDPDRAPRLGIPEGIPFDLVNDAAGAGLFQHLRLADESLPVLIGPGF